jgi:AraC-like DNA-binding protein
MPIYMDLHIAPGVTAREVAEAHLLDVKIQEDFSCKAMTYWHDEDKGCVFCLIEAPDQESVRELHLKAHGLVPNEIITVNSDIVKAFLGRIQDPPNQTQPAGTELKIFSDPAFRIILVLKTIDSRLLQQTLGKERTQELLLLYSTIIRGEVKTFGGSEVYSREEGFVISFESPAKATECALAIQKQLQKAAPLIGLRIGLHGGVPVSKDKAIFGDTIKFADLLCDIGNVNQVTMSASVRSLFKDNDWNVIVNDGKTRSITNSEETFLLLMLQTLAANWQDPEFDIPEFCRLMSMSKSQLYRKAVSVTGMSPKMLLREYRLLRSLALLRNEEQNISETTFDAGFTSPSYFTKCFQKRFGIQPLAYLKARS